jgi:hypothetical protein
MSSRSSGSPKPQNDTSSECIFPASSVSTAKCQATVFKYGIAHHIPISSMSGRRSELRDMMRLLHLVISDRSKFNIGVRNCRLGTVSRAFPERVGTDAMQLVKSICWIVSEQKARAWNSWWSSELCCKVRTSSCSSVTPESSS